MLDDLVDLAKPVSETVHPTAGEKWMMAFLRRIALFNQANPRILSFFSVKVVSLLFCFERCAPREMGTPRSEPLAALSSRVGSGKWLKHNY